MSCIYTIELNGNTIKLNETEFREYVENTYFPELLTNEQRKEREDKLSDVEEQQQGSKTYGSVSKVISGGQTGVDRIALEVAKELGLETGGTAPKGFKTESGNDSSLKEFGVVESDKSDYPTRTKKNVADSDGTIYLSKKSSAGLSATRSEAEKLGKPFLQSIDEFEIAEFIKENGIKTLNIAGNRGSKLDKMQSEAIADSIKEALISLGEQSQQSTEEGTDNKSLLKETVDTVAEQEFRNQQLESLNNFDGELSKKDIKEFDQNKLLDIHLSVMSNSNPILQRQIAKPLAFGKLKQLSTEVPVTKKSRRFSGMSPSFQKDAYMDGRSGSTGIGMFSLDSVFNASIQGKDVRLNKSELKKVKIGGVELSTDLSNPFTIASQKILNKYKYKDKEKKQQRSLTEILNVISDKDSKKLEYKSDVISYFQSASLDNANEKLLGILNINSETFDAIRILNASGFSEEHTIALINQPIIKDYIELIQTFGDAFSDASLRKGIKQKAKEAVLKKYTGRTPSRKRRTETVSEITLKELKDNLNYNYEDSIPEINKEQEIALDQFIELSRIGEKLGQYQMAVNSDSSGVPGTALAAKEKVDAIGEMFMDNTFVNIQKVLGTVINTEDYNKLPLSTQLDYYPVRHYHIDKYRTSYIKPETIKGFATIHATYFAFSQFDDFFPYNSHGFNNVLTQIQNIMGSKKLTTNQKMNIWVQMKRYTNSVIFSKNPVQRRIDLMTNIEGDSLSDRLNKYVDRNTDNAFVKSLKIESNKNELDKITFNAFNSLTNDKSPYYAGFLQLLEEDKQLADDLVEYAFLSGGVQGAKEFVKFIPPSYFTATENGERIRNIDYGNIETYGSTSFDNISRFTIQYFQHNPWLVKNSIDRLSIKDDYNKEGDKITFTSDYKEKLKKAKKGFPRFIKSNNDLYVIENINVGRYKKIPSFKTNVFTQYDPTNEIANEIKFNRDKKHYEIDEDLNKEEAKTKVTAVSNTKEDIKTAEGNPYGNSEIVEDDPRGVVSTDEDVTNSMPSRLEKQNIFTNNNEVKPIDKIFESISESETIAGKYKAIARNLKLLKINDVDVEIISEAEMMERTGKNAEGVFVKGEKNKIYLKKNLKNPQAQVHAFLHEASHAATVPMIEQYYKTRKDGADTEIEVGKMIEAFNLEVNEYLKGKKRGAYDASVISGVHERDSQGYIDTLFFIKEYIDKQKGTIKKHSEFLALMFSNPTFIDFADNTRFKGINNKSIFKSLIDLFSKILSELTKAEGDSTTLLKHGIESVIKINNYKNPENSTGNAIYALYLSGFTEEYTINQNDIDAIDNAISKGLLENNASKIKKYIELKYTC